MASLFHMDVLLACDFNGDRAVCINIMTTTYVYISGNKSTSDPHGKPACSITIVNAVTAMERDHKARNMKIYHNAISGERRPSKLVD
mmetsp:Transcript_4181/g.11530  ORF Transcript_4181/g.11530 Transcript_4181/m.11530 type:complete len:87 (+) Transcript_4181:2801-3061(+)